MKRDAYAQMGFPRPATAPAPGQVPNHTGGYVYEISDAERAKRFLILGSAGGTYYQREHDITRENFDVILAAAAADPEALAELIADVSERGIAPKVDPQLFALAVMTATPGPGRVAGFSVFPRVIRTGGHLLQWARYYRSLGGGVSRSWRRTVSDWYAERDSEALAYQLAKYGQRDGRSQKDLIDLSHVLGRADLSRSGQMALSWARHRPENELDQAYLPELLRALDADAPAVELIDAGASWEMLPDADLRDPATWHLLIARKRLPLTALIRNLPRLTELGVIGKLGNAATREAITRALTDKTMLRRARIHPINVLVAQKAYASGQTRSKLRFTPVPWVLDALEDAFDLSFTTAPASGKRHLIGVDISSSMTWATPFGGLSSHEIATVLALKLLRSEPQSYAVGFASSIRELGMHPKMTLTEALRRAQGSFGATDPSALIRYASAHGLAVDTFVMVTDNEVNRGYNVAETLRAYRQETGVPAKLIVLATTSTGFSVADPADPGMLDCAGFGSDVPALITEFSRGF